MAGLVKLHWVKMELGNCSDTILLITGILYSETENISLLER